jgi:hypothetical protein
MNNPDLISQIASPSETNTIEQFTWLDLLLVIVENLRLLVLGPLVAGLVAFVGASLMPKTYESTAILNAEQATASLMNSASVLDPIAVDLGYTQKLGMDEARLKIKKEVQIHFNAKDKLLNVTAQAQTPQAAQVLVQAVLNQTYLKSKPRDSEKLRLQKQLEQAQNQEKQAYQSANILGKKLDTVAIAGGSDLVQGYAQMLRVLQESQEKQLDIEKQLNGLDSSVLVQEPTLPSKHKDDKRGLITLLVVQLVGFILFVGIFVIRAFRGAAENFNSTKKIKNIKTAWRKTFGFSM